MTFGGCTLNFGQNITSKGQTKGLYSCNWWHLQRIHITVRVTDIHVTD